MRDQFIETITELAKKDDRIFLITGDLGFKVLDNFIATCPDQFLNAGIAEQNMTGIAAGLALEGRIVFTYSIANFPTFRCLEQLRNDVAYHDLNVNVVSVGAGFSYGALGMSHHATEDIALMRSMPGMTVGVPSDFIETDGITRFFTEKKGPGYLRIDKSWITGDNASSGDFSFSKARVVKEGTDVTLMSVGGILEEVLVAEEMLSSLGVSCRVLSFHSVKPIDSAAIIAACKETKGILTVEEHVLDGGFGSAVSEVCMDNNVFPKKFSRIGLSNVFSSVVGSQKYLRKHYKMDSNAIIERVQKMLS